MTRQLRRRPSAGPRDERRDRGHASHPHSGHSVWSCRPMGGVGMAIEAVARPIEREYRSVMSDNRRWERFAFRPGDIVVCTPAKCGTTWMQAIVATLLFPDGAPGPVMEIAPWLTRASSRSTRSSDCSRRRRTADPSRPTPRPMEFPGIRPTCYLVVGRTVGMRSCRSRTICVTCESNNCPTWSGTRCRTASISAPVRRLLLLMTCTRSSRGVSIRTQSGSSTSRVLSASPR